MLNLTAVSILFLIANSYAVLVDDVGEDVNVLTAHLRDLKLVETFHEGPLILPADDKKSNWGDRIEICAANTSEDDVLFTRLYINPKSKKQRMYKFEKRICANYIITETRFINTGRQRGLVQNVTIHRSRLTEDLIEAIFVAKPEEQFRILVEVYGYDPNNSAHSLQSSSILIAFYMVYMVLIFIAYN